jgi:putative acetyltransferase
MMVAMLIRTEQRDDEAAITAVVEQAFGRSDEARLVARLRSDGDAVISLVAVVGNLVAGHVMFSCIVAPFRALGLAPVSVMPEHQRRGIGRSLVAEGLKQAREQGWEAVFVVGDPDYYERFGFRVDLAKGFSSPYAGPHFMALALGVDLPVSGRIDYASAFASLA